MRSILFATLLLCGLLAGCATFSHRPVAENVVRCREQCQAGLEASRAGRSQAAHDMFAAAVKSCPADERARRLHAEALWQQGEASAAIEEMHEAARLSGSDAALLVRLGEMHLAGGNLQSAAHYAAAAIAAAPQLAEAWALEGDVLRQREDTSAALARYHRALAYRPEFPAVQFAVSELYLQQGRHSRALAALVSLAQQYEPQTAPQRLYVLRADCFKQLGRWTEAAEQFELAARVAPPTSGLLYELADCRWRCGDREAARLATEQALAIEPAHVPARRLMAQLDRAIY